MAKFGWASRYFDGETVFIFGGGPSLTKDQVDAVHKHHQIAINDSYKLAPLADILYFCDRKWWQRHSLAVLASEIRFVVTLADVPEAQTGEVLRLRRGPQYGFCEDPSALCDGSNSGYQAIHLAAHFGAKRIVLLGYDMRVVNGKTHWHGGHPDTQPTAYADTLRQSFLPMFQHLVEPLKQRGIEVINCTPGSALTCWPIRPLEEVLAEEERKAA